MHGWLNRQDGGRRARGAAAIVLSAGIMVPAAAQVVAPGQQPQPNRQARPLDITGENFAGQRLPVNISEGVIELAAAKAWRWTSPGPARTDGSPLPPAQRILLSGDVEVRLGSYVFNAARAAVWLAPLDGSEGVWQVFAYFDRAGTPTEDATVAIWGDRLPVQGIIKAESGPSLKATLVTAGSPGEDDAAFVREGERALAMKLRGLVAGKEPPRLSPDDLARQGLPIPALQPGLMRAYEPRAFEDPRNVAAFERGLPPAERDEPIFASTGVISFYSAGTIKTVAGADETAIVISGETTVQYWARDKDQTLELTAERGVIFTEAGTPADATQLEVSKVRGIYLEGNVVATIVTPKGKYSIRSPKVYYSIKDDRALLVDAVFWTYDERRGLPLYVRAKSISQRSANEFHATSATMTNTAFFNPDFSIGTRSLTLSRRKSDDGDSRIYIDARDITLNAGGLPFFYWPILRGEPETIPLKDVRVENSSGSGTAIKTMWNLYGLLGIRKKGSNDEADLLVDYYFDRGMAFGSKLNWSDQSSKGGLLVYTLPEDRGRDVLVTGQKKEFDGKWRGIATLEHQQALSDEWSIFVEGSYISDETFMDGFFERTAQERREFTNSLYARRLKENSALWAEVRGTFNNFIANQYLIQTPGYVVEKLPDIGYARIADDMISSSPGLLTYSHEYRLTRMQLKFDEKEAREFGFADPTRAAKSFGINPTQSIADRLRAEGYVEEPVDRFDTRHELGMQLAAGPVIIQPFVTGRLTAYDDDFNQFSSNADEQFRLWASEGVTASTELQRVDNGVESRLFDLHRMRHIIQPSLTVWHADSTIDRVDLPVYDDSVESLAEGTATRFGLNQTWQTQRGGPGRWRSVDVVKLNGEVVISSDDVDKESPIGRYIDYRPELSNLGGSFGDLNASWQVTEIFGLGALTVYDFDDRHLQKSAIGGTLQHTPDFATYADWRTINSQEQTYVVLGATYQLTPKYGLDLSGSYDTQLGEFQSVAANVRRRFPSVILGVGVSYNNITDESSFGIMIQPVGVQGPGARLQGLGGAGGTGFGG